MKVMLVAMVAVVGLIASSGFANGTIKDTCGNAPDAFKTWRETSLARRGGWYAKAEKTVPKLYSREVKPVGLVKVLPDAAAFQGWRALPAGEIDLGDGRVLVHPAPVVAPTPQPICQCDPLPYGQFAFTTWRFGVLEF